MSKDTYITGDDYREMREEESRRKEKARMTNTELMTFLAAEMDIDIEKFSDYHYRLRHGTFKVYLDYYPTKSQGRVEGTTKYFHIWDLEKYLNHFFN